MLILVFFFFFSSRRRHTRLTCDWSSDVCSSDLVERGGDGAAVDEAGRALVAGLEAQSAREPLRSEERRGGEEWRTRGVPDYLKKKKEERTREGEKRKGKGTGRGQVIEKGTTDCD